MNTAAQPEIIGLGVSRDWLDLHCLSDDRRLRLPNTDEGHSKLEEIAAGREALVCFDAAGGHEWRLWAGMAAAGVEARQLPPAQAEAFGRSRGTLAKTDRIDAELIARFMAFRPEAGRRLPSGRLRDPGTPATKRRQLVEMRKSARQQTKADLRNGAAEPVEDLTGELLELLERQISEVEERIAGLLANDAVLAETAALLQSVPGIGPVACTMPVAEMPELGRISGESSVPIFLQFRSGMSRCPTSFQSDARLQRRQNACPADKIQPKPAGLSAKPRQTHESRIRKGAKLKNYNKLACDMSDPHSF